METSFHLSLLISLPLLLVFLAWFPCFFTVNADPSKETQILLQMKHALEDAHGFLDNWHPSSDSSCNWTGVQCSEDGAVTALDFTNFNLSGSVPTVMCQLPKLVHVNFYYNNFGGFFPAELPKSCVGLTLLNLSQNWIVGSLPGDIDQIKGLQVLDLSANVFSGPIPEAFGRLPELLVLDLYTNILNGTIPSFLGLLTKLQYLRLAYNQFTPGPIPPELGNLRELTYLWLTGCNLLGTIPDIFANMTKLTNVDFSMNRLTGSIPRSIMELRFLYQLELYKNQLTGPIPENLGNLLSIVKIDMQQNRLTGPIPQSISRLRNLSSLYLENNSLSGEIPDGLAELPYLQDLSMYYNKFSGMLPRNLGNSSQLSLIDLSYNRFSGPLPPNICAGGNLQYLIFMQNHLSGTIPESYARCTKVTRLRLSYNELSGRVPEGLWGLPALYILDLANNKLEGNISPSIAKAINLSTMYLENNKFSGRLPAHLGNLNLSVITIQYNSFSSQIPRELGMLHNLNRLELHHNSFSGEIPTDIGFCQQLETFDLSNNQLTGPIPFSIGGLRSLHSLDLSNNRLSGQIPLSLANLTTLTKFNVSNNSLSGAVPSGLTFVTFQTSFMENQGLCGDNLIDVKPCKSKRISKPLQGIVAGILAVASLMLLSGLAWFRKRFKQHVLTNKRSEELVWSLKSFHKLGFSEYEILGRLDEDNVIGEGGAGKVYKVTLGNQETVAVKRLWNDERKGRVRRDNGFNAEIETLGKIRHKNIVKLLCCCSNRESNLLVYEYMPNGSLGSLLHGTTASTLDWASRHRIALGAAQGLAYLHRDCSPTIVHRDVKSNNILLDSDYEARISDFGLAKILEDKKGDSSGIVGTHGYIAPEHAFTSKVTEKSDIYSFGVVLLELVTGKKPINVSEFGEGRDIVKWVLGKLEDPEGVIDVLDSRLLDSSKDNMLPVLKVALLCTAASPIHRPSMRQVVEMLMEADPELKFKNGKDSESFERPSFIQISVQELV